MVSEHILYIQMIPLREPFSCVQKNSVEVTQQKTIPEQLSEISVCPCQFEFTVVQTGHEQTREDGVQSVCVGFFFVCVYMHECVLSS